MVCPEIVLAVILASLQNSVRCQVYREQFSTWNLSEFRFGMWRFRRQLW
jgi:hypothetical protein